MIVFGLVLCGVAILSSAAEGAWQRRDTGYPRRTNTWLLLVAALLIGVASLRWRVGTDYETYVRLYPQYVAEARQSLALLGEPGLRWIALIASRIGTGSEGMFAFAAIITIGLTVRTLWRWSPAFALSAALYVLSGAWHGSFNGVRQYLACAVLFAGHRYIVDRRLLKWAVVVLVAMLFHVSAIVGILMYLVPVRRTSLGVQTAMVGLGAVGMATMGNILAFLEASTGDTERWAGEYAQQEVNPLRVAFAFVPLIVYWFVRGDKYISRHNGWFYVNMLAVYGAVYLASLNSAMVARFASYPLQFVPLGVAYATYAQDELNRTALRFGMLLLYATFLYVELSGIGNLRNFRWLFESA